MFYKNNMALFYYNGQSGPLGDVRDGGGYPVSSLGKSFARYTTYEGHRPQRNTLCLVSASTGGVCLPNWDVLVGGNVTFGGNVSLLNLTIGGFNPNLLA
ncbi:unnamed protein product [Blepharisma stoltei]|uniref:Uncharacterized protein n=1 Tax=Blepharisma stoltei TaxID=1481888 RepID=A0AAU9KDT7_9CILI|nr:unnamed protein product [Blepharisma stoltei]